MRHAIEALKCFGVGLLVTAGAIAGGIALVRILDRFDAWCDRRQSEAILIVVVVVFGAAAIVGVYLLGCEILHGR